MDNDTLKLELAAYLITTNLAAFSLGMLIVVVEFQVLQFLVGLEIYHLLAIAIGLFFLVIWSYRLLSELKGRLAQATD